MTDPIPARVKLDMFFFELINNTSRDSAKISRTIEFTYFNRKTRRFKMMKFKKL